MHLQFLGTSAGLPSKARNVSATAVIEATGSSWYLVDCGEATQHQLLYTSLSLRDLRAIFITHVHGDHCFGLPGLLASASMSGRTEPLPLILPAALHDWLRLTLAVSDTGLSFELQLQAVEAFASWNNGRIQVSSVALSHRVPSHGYVFSELNPEPRLDLARLEADAIPRGPLWGDLAKGLEVQHEGRSIAPGHYLCASRKARKVIVCGDNDTPELLAEVAQGADILVHEATFTQARIQHMGESFGHSSAASIAAFAEAAGVINLVLTHFSARYQGDPRRSPNIDDIREEAKAQYSGCLTLAQDLQRYQLDRAGRLVPHTA